jgi:membrane-associated protease RseP (regulator of RpoE activity)
LTGFFTALVGFLLHEWAHLAGALATGSKVHYPNRVLAPLLFHFDTEENDRAQFLAMSYGGYVGSAIGTLAILLFAPLDTLAGRTALGLAVVGGIVTAVAEVPTTVRVLRGGPLPTGYAFVPPRP